LATFSFFVPVPQIYAYAMAKKKGEFNPYYPYPSHPGKVNWIPSAFKKKKNLKDLRKKAFFSFYTLLKLINVSLKIIRYSSLREWKHWVYFGLRLFLRSSWR